MEIEDVKRELERINKEYEVVLIDFNERRGNFNLKNLTERARKTDINRRYNIPWDSRFPILLAIGDLNDMFIESGVLKIIHDFAEDKGWKCSASEFARWEDDSSKLMGLKDVTDLSSCFSFHCEKTSKASYRTIETTGGPIIEIYPDDGEYKARFFSNIMERIGRMDE